jgi:TPR repeat protein
MNKQEALSAIRLEVGALAVGVLLGAVAFWFIRPKQKARSPLEMAHRWSSWGLFAALPTAALFYVRQPGASGIAGGLLGLLFYGGGAWLLGLAWGFIRFRLLATPNKALAATTPQTSKPASPNLLPIVAAVGAVLLLALVGISFLKSKLNTEQVSQVAQSAPDGPRHIAEGFLKPDGNEVDEAKLEAAVQRADPPAQYLMGMRAILGSWDFLAPHTPGVHSWHGSGLPGEPPSLRESAPFRTKAEQQRDGFALLRSAADQGYPAAQFALYECYDRGLLAQKDPEAASRLLQLAFAQGYPYALLEKAELVDTDNKVRVQALRDAAAQQMPVAMHAVAEIITATANSSAYDQLLEHYGKDEVRSAPLGLFERLKAKEGSSSSNRKVTNRVVDLDDRATAEAWDRFWNQALQTESMATAIQLYTAAAAQGYVPAKRSLASLLAPSEQLTDRAKALDLYKAAAYSGHFWAIMDLGMVYYDGELCPRDEVEALAWAYVAQAHPQFAKLPPPPEEDSFLRKYYLESFQAKIPELQARLGADARVVAQERARQIHATISENNSVWYGADARPADGVVRHLDGRYDQ